MSSPCTKSSVQIEQVCREGPGERFDVTHIFEKPFIDSGSLPAIRDGILVWSLAVIVGCPAGANVSCSAVTGHRGLLFEAARRPALNLKMGIESSSAPLSPAARLPGPVSRITPKAEPWEPFDFAIEYIRAKQSTRAKARTVATVVPGVESSCESSRGRTAIVHSP